MAPHGMEVLMRILFFLILTFLTLKAEDALLLNAHIKMIPKIMALDSRLSSRASSIKPVLAIVYEGNRKRMAENIAENIAEEITLTHNGKVANLSFSTIVLSVDELLLRRDISFVYLTKMGNASVRKIGVWGVSNTIPTFSYDVSNIDDGILGSIAIERATVIYINKTILKEGKFRFNDTLFQIARLVE